MDYQFAGKISKALRRIVGGTIRPLQPSVLVKQNGFN
jgi:hypothetical protein